MVVLKQEAMSHADISAHPERGACAHDHTLSCVHSEKQKMSLLPSRIAGHLRLLTGCLRGLESYCGWLRGVIRCDCKQGKLASADEGAR